MLCWVKEEDNLIYNLKNGLKVQEEEMSSNNLVLQYTSTLVTDKQKLNQFSDSLVGR